MSNEKTNISRRNLLKGIAAAGAVGAMGGFGISTVLAAPKTVNMGFIYVGPRDDYGYNQSHFEGKSAVAKLDWVKAVDEENVPETIEVVKTIGKYDQPQWCTGPVPDFVWLFQSVYPRDSTQVS